MRGVSSRLTYLHLFRVGGRSYAVVDVHNKAPNFADKVCAVKDYKALFPMNVFDPKVGPLARPGSAPRRRGSDLLFSPELLWAICSALQMLAQDPQMQLL